MHIRSTHRARRSISWSPQRVTCRCWARIWVDTGRWGGPGEVSAPRAHTTRLGLGYRSNRSWRPPSPRSNQRPPTSCLLQCVLHCCCCCPAVLPTPCRHGECRLQARPLKREWSSPTPIPSRDPSPSRQRIPTRNTVPKAYTCRLG